ncbi:MAG: roadblock/LC7 domain-containing protein [Planctomycetota bacterium]|jgi:predicted regulator of Ras-like GTPase activity (Roadblock/LC7/MglB family)
MMQRPSRTYSDADLRDSRLVFYKEDVQGIDGTLREFLSRSKSKAAMLVDKDGHLITQEGSTEKMDTDTISALVAGCFAATREMARIMGEEEFSALFHQGRKDNLQLSLVGQRTILAVLFDDSTTIGMVRLYAAEAARKLTSLFKKIVARSGTASGTEEIDEGFQEAAANTLENVFGAD